MYNIQHINNKCIYDLVLLLVGVRFLDHFLPDDLGQVDRQPVADHQDAQVAQVFLV